MHLTQQKMAFFVARVVAGLLTFVPCFLWICLDRVKNSIGIKKIKIVNENSKKIIIIG
jgi:hypothetical protein